MVDSTSRKAKPAVDKRTRRRVLRGLGAAGAGAVVGAASRWSFAQGKAPINLSFWTFDNPQQRPWLAKRIKLYTDKNPNVKVDFQWFPFGDLGKKLSVGFATGTAPEGFVSQDWFMPTWLDKGLIAPHGRVASRLLVAGGVHQRLRAGVRQRRDQGRQGLRLSAVVLRLPATT